MVWQSYATPPLILLCVLAFGFVLGHESLVSDYSGSGASNTRPFTVEAGWEIQWTASGDIFQLYLHNMNGDMVDVAANQIGAGSGGSYQPHAGTYYLQVNALGSWTVRIVQLGQDVDRVIPDGKLEFTGNGARNTRPFVVDGPWEVQWDATGDIFQIYLYTRNGDLVSVAANQMGGGTGASFQPEEGSYYLQVNATGTWTIRIVPLR